MSQKIFCYHCRTHHSPEQMVRVETRTGARWRCLRTIAAAQRSIEEREAFGRAQSEANRAEAKHMAERMRRMIHPGTPA